MSDTLEILFLNDRQYAKVLNFFKKMKKARSDVMNSDILLSLVEFANSNYDEFKRFFDKKVEEYKLQRINDANRLVNIYKKIYKK